MRSKEWNKSLPCKANCMIICPCLSSFQVLDLIEFNLIFLVFTYNLMYYSRWPIAALVKNKLIVLLEKTRKTMIEI